MKNLKMISLICIAALLAGCGPGKLFGPTLTATSTNTPVPSKTPLPTNTPTATATSTSTPTATKKLTNTPSPTSACSITKGNWESKETAEFFGFPTPILTFKVSNCQISSWSITAYPAEGELFMWEGTKIDVTGSQFSHAEDTGDGIFTIEGLFDSATACHGTLLFPKGFSIFGYVLDEDVIIPWTASPVK
jgi:hypothetical protein